MHVLLVESSAEFARLAVRMLEEHPAVDRVTLARSVKDASRVITDSAPHLILTDLAFVDGNGFHIARLAKKSGSTPVVLLVLFEDAEYEAAAGRGTGVDAVVAKKRWAEQMPHLLARFGPNGR